MLKESLKIGNSVIQSQEILSLLHRYQMLPQLVRNIIVDQAIANISCTPEDVMVAMESFASQQQITSEEAKAAWLAKQGITAEQMQELAIRVWKLEKFKTTTWTPKVESYYLTRKTSLDQVVYSLIRTRDLGVAQEIYFRIKEGEQSFNELAQTYSQGAEAKSGGLLGPVPISQPHPSIAKILSVSQPGQLWTPRQIGEWFVIIRLEKMITAQLDEAMRYRLINELFEIWLQEQMKTVEILSSPNSCAA
jgi:parvulin-like peptidyl-prolyl isomerase